MNKPLSYENTRFYLNTNYIGRSIINLNSTASTNDYAKNIALTQNEGTVVTAEKQDSGKGRLGRSWASPEGKGIYMSIILKPNLHPSMAPKLTLIGAAAVNKALMDIGIESQIKWPNDIVIEGKKVCGILTEMTSEQNLISYIVVGIGINVNLDEIDIPSDLKDKATSLKLVKDNHIDRNQLFALILNYFEHLYNAYKIDLNLEETIRICKEKSALIGNDVQIIEKEQIRIGKAVDINNDGELLVKFDTGIVVDRRYIHQNAELDNELTETTKYVVERLTQMGYEPQIISKSAIVALAGGKKPGKTFLLRADMDALPIVEDNELEYKSKTQNMHACGHDTHTAMLLGAAQLLKNHEDELEGTVKLMFQPGEETLSGARAMVEAGVL